MAAHKSKRKEHHEEHPDERWLITYADMITLLMVLFIVMFAISQVDQEKFAELSGGLAVGFGGEKPGLPGGSGVMTGREGVTGDAVVASVALNPLSQAQATSLQKADAAAQADRAELARAQAALQSAIDAAGLSSQASLGLTERGLVVTLVTDEVLFASGDASLAPQGRELMDAIGPVLSRLPHHVSVEGHTDNVPISGRYANNWELSAARATSVLGELISREGLAPDRLSATGYADTRPIEPMDTAEHRARNRRVEVVVLARPAAVEVVSAAGPAGGSAGIAPDLAPATAVVPDIVPDLKPHEESSDGH